MKEKIAIFHFSPLELYPPVMNFLDCLDEVLPPQFIITVYSTSGKAGTIQYNPRSRRMLIRRDAKFSFGLGAFDRLFQYARYYLRSLFHCMAWKPKWIVYYESISSLTPYIIKRWINRDVRLFIHYHEYMTPNEYQKMYLNRVLHEKEKTIYPKCEWISHTNAERMKMFMNDLNLPGLSNTHIFPNYPPDRWKSDRVIDKLTFPLRLVYIGSLSSIDALYIRETLHWVKCSRGKVVLDLYAHQAAPEIELFVKELHCDGVALKGPVNYQDIPRILNNYEIGLILYKGGSQNTIHSVSNKLFEYLVCGLDVWYPQEIIGSHPYDSDQYWPKVMRLDFSKLEQYDLDKVTEHREGFKRVVNYSCENASREMIDKILSKS